MATYKVIQDIEAEDKLLGPLTLRQFIYAVIVAVSGFLAFRLFLVSPWLVLPFIPHMILFSILASPFGNDQPSEVWLLAKVRFALKPRRRIWDQNGIKDIVTINAPKRVEHQLTDNLTQTEVESRLQALANTIDSRGWAVKNVDVNLYTQPTYMAGQSDPDRLINVSQMAQEVPAEDFRDTPDIFDEQSSPIAQNLDQMIDKSSQNHRQRIIEKIQQNTQPAKSAQQPDQPQPDYWFLNNKPNPADLGDDKAMFGHSPLVQPGQAEQAPTPPSNHPDTNTSREEESKLAQSLRQRQAETNPYKSQLKTIQPLSTTAPSDQPATNHAVDTPKQKPQTPSTTPNDPAILELASNDDLNVETIVRQANQRRNNSQDDDEIVISLRK